MSMRDHPNGVIYETVRYDYWVRSGDFGTVMRYHDNRNADSATWSSPLLLDPDLTNNGYWRYQLETKQFIARISDDPRNGVFAGQTIVSEPCLHQPRPMTESMEARLLDKYETQIFDKENYNYKYLFTASMDWDSDKENHPMNIPSDILAKKKRKGIDLGFDNPSNEDQYGQ